MKKKNKKHGFAGKIISGILLSLILAAVFSSGLFYMYVRSIDTNLDTSELFSKQGLTTKLYFRNAAGAAVELESQRLYGEQNRIFIPLASVPEHVKNAFIAIEDHRFREHKGIDLRRTAGAVLSFLSPSSGGYGGSTITQQLIKNLTGENQATVGRKLKEALRAFALEKKLSKDEILELYLNTVYLSQGCYGLETASEKYFGKRADELSISEGASLAAIIRYPTRYDPIIHPDNNTERRNIILFRMFELGYISEDEYGSALDEKVTLKPTKKTTGAKNTWFTDAVIEQVTHDLISDLGMTRKEASSLIYGGGLTIYTTQNIEMQEMLEEMYLGTSIFPAVYGLPPQSSAIIMDKTGAVLAVVGGRGEKSSDRIFNLATRLLRSPGSVIKPVSVYAPALDRKLITWASVFDDVPVTVSKAGSSYNLWPKNNPRVYSGLTTVSRALKVSTNTVSVRVLEKLGCRESFDFLRDKAGITTLLEGRKTENGQTISDIAPAPLALGASSDGVSLSEMTAAYTMFLNQGVCSRVHFYSEVYDRNGNLLLSHDGRSVKAISPDSADIMTRLMENVVKTGGTASCIKLKNKTDVAGKTGTSNSNTDRWFIGYTPDLLCGVWYGYKDARDIGYYKNNPAAQIFDSVMTKAESLLTERHEHFTRSDNVVSCLYCRDSGLVPSKACLFDPRGSRIETGYFVRGTEPKEKCDTHITVEISEDGGVDIEENSKNTRRCSLIKVNRSFPCQVKITDAQYVYRELPHDKAPCQDPACAYFDTLRASGEYFGTSGVSYAFNRLSERKNVENSEFEDESESDNIIPETDE